MSPKPTSTAGKAPASTVSKTPANPTEGAKAAKKTASEPTGEVGDERKKRREVRKETYSSYIYKGELLFTTNHGFHVLLLFKVVK
jgi:histone H2B